MHPAPWTCKLHKLCRAGFLLFVVLTVVTIYSRPSSFAKGFELMGSVESQLGSFGQHHLQQLVDLEQRFMAYGQSNWAEVQGYVQSSAVSLRAFQEQKIKHSKRTMKDLLTRQSTMLGLVQQAKTNLGALEDKLYQFGVSNLQSLEQQFSSFGRTSLSELEEVVASVASMLDKKLKAARWPVVVFTVGAMICMLTSSVCHLLGCCNRELALRIWRFDYAGIAVLIVTSFFPPVHYAFHCHRALRLFYLVTTSLLGAWR